MPPRKLTIDFIVLDVRPQQVKGRATQENDKFPRHEIGLPIVTGQKPTLRKKIACLWIRFPPSRSRSRCCRAKGMTPIVAKVLNVDRQGGEYIVIVNVGREKIFRPIRQTRFREQARRWLVSLRFG
jgi:hypothetical protein